MNNGLLKVLCAGMIACSLPVGGAMAAVTVIGSGSAQLCFQAADTGRAQREAIEYCNDALVGALRRLANEPDTVAQMGAAARRLLETRFSRAQAFERWRALLERLD